MKQWKRSLVVVSVWVTVISCFAWKAASDGTRMVKQSTGDSGGIVLEQEYITDRCPALYALLAKTSSYTKGDGDISLTNTAWTAVPGFQIEFTNDVPVHALIVANVYGKISDTNEEVHLTTYLDGTNIAGWGGLSMSDSDRIGSLKFSGIPASSISTGAHVVAIGGRVSGGTATICADLSNSIPATLSALLIGECM